MTDFEKLGLFYLGREVDPATRVRRDVPWLGKVGRESQDVTRASENGSALTQQLHDLQAALESDLQAVSAEWDRSAELLERVLVKPKRGACQCNWWLSPGSRAYDDRCGK